MFSAFHSLIRSPRYAVIAGLMVALGLGACTTIFSLFDSLLLRERPGVVDSATLVDIGRAQEGSAFDNLAFPDYVDLRARTRALSDVAALRFAPANAGLVIDHEAEPAQAQWVTSNFLHVLGTRLELGRDFTTDGHAAPEIILSHAFWQKRFGGNPGVIGRTVTFNRTRVVIVGVTERGFTGSSIVTADFWAPLSLWETVHPGNPLLTGRANVGFLALGRLAPGATLAAAQAELAVIARTLEQAYPETNKGRRLVALRSSRLPGDFGRMAGVFLGLLGTLALLALAVTCTNVGGLMLARCALRRRELAVRAALGADRGQLVRLLLGEHLVLFVLGAGGGLLLATWLVDLLRVAVSHASLPVTLDLTLSPLGAGFTLAAALLAGLACGLGPALGSTRFDLLPALRAGEQPAGSRFFSLRNIFLTTQLTVSFALLGTAGLLTRALQTVASADTGYDLARVESASFDFSILNLSGQPAAAFRDALLARVTGDARVESAAWSAHVPLTGEGLAFDQLLLPGADPRNEIRTDWNLVSPSYFTTMRLALLRGRDFTAADRAGAPLVAIVNETFARTTWPNRDPLGQILLNSTHQAVTVIGVARDANYRMLGEAPRNFIYCPIAQLDSRSAGLFVRSRDGASVASLVREATRQLEPGLPVADVQRLESLAAAGLLPHRIALAGAASAGALALLLSATGVYGATLFWASTRTREFGLRMALGATSRQLIGFALRGVARTLVVATAVGLIATLGLAQLASAALTQIPPDPFVLGGTTMLFSFLVLAAAWFPARRAVKIDPMTALRSE